MFIKEILMTIALIIFLGGMLYCTYIITRDDEDMPAA